MAVYLLVFFLSLLYYCYAQTIELQMSKPLLFGYMMFLAFFVGLGDMIGGYDRYIYGEIFDSIADTLHSESKLSGLYFLVNGSEYGYFWWQVFVALFTCNRYIYILITTLVVYLLYYRAFSEHLKNYPMATIIFMGLLFYFTQTYLRQVIAMGIAWQGIRFVWERKFWKYFAFVVLAFTFHSSSLILLLLYFIPIKKYSPGNVITWLTFCLILGLTPLPNALMTITGEATEMAERMEEYTHEDQGFRPEYVLEVIFFMYILIKNYRLVDTTKRGLVFCNMTIIFCSILFIFMRFGQGGRISWYFMFGLIYTFSHIASYWRTAYWVRPLMIFVCFALYLRTTYAWREQNTPYKTFLTNGIPSGEAVYEKFEYDDVYTRDKLYR